MRWQGVGVATGAEGCGYYERRGRHPPAAPPPPSHTHTTDVDRHQQIVQEAWHSPMLRRYHTVANQPLWSPAPCTSDGGPSRQQGGGKRHGPAFINMPALHAAQYRRRWCADVAAERRSARNSPSRCRPGPGRPSLLRRNPPSASGKVGLTDGRSRKLVCWPTGPRQDVSAHASCQDQIRGREGPVSCRDDPGPVLNCDAMPSPAQLWELMRPQGTCKR